MPPRHAYWTIIVDDQPTSFRAHDVEELLPTFNRLREKHPNAQLKWFERGQLWESRDAAREHGFGQGERRWEGPRPSRGEGEHDEPRRDATWRPGGEHRDPRQKYKDAKKAKWDRYKQQIRSRWEEKSGPRPDQGPHTPPPGDPMRPKVADRDESRPGGRPRSEGDRREWRGRPEGRRPDDSRGDWRSSKGGPQGDRRDSWRGRENPREDTRQEDRGGEGTRKSWGGKPAGGGGRRTWGGKPTSGAGRKSWGGKPASAGPRKTWRDKPPGTGPRKPWGDKPTAGGGRKPWAKGPPGAGGARKPWGSKPSGATGTGKPWGKKPPGSGGRKPWGAKPGGGGFRKKPFDAGPGGRTRSPKKRREDEE